MSRRPLSGWVSIGTISAKCVRLYSPLAGPEKAKNGSLSDREVGPRERFGLGGHHVQWISITRGVGLGIGVPPSGHRGPRGAGRPGFAHNIQPAAPAGYVLADGKLWSFGAYSPKATSGSPGRKLLVRCARSPTRRVRAVATRPRASCACSQRARAAGTSPSADRERVGERACVGRGFGRSRRDVGPERERGVADDADPPARHRRNRDVDDHLDEGFRGGADQLAERGRQERGERRSSARWSSRTAPAASDRSWRTPARSMRSVLERGALRHVAVPDPVHRRAGRPRPGRGIS